MLKRCWRCAVCFSLTKQSENGASNLASPMLAICNDELRGPVTSGILMKCSSRSMDAFITYGVRLIRMEMFWTSWSKAAETRKPPRSSPQTIKGPKVCAACNHHRQAEGLQRCQGRSVSECRTLATEVWEQPRAEFTSANPIAGAIDETVQITRARATFLSVFGIIGSHFRVGRHLYGTSGYRTVMRLRFAFWKEVIRVGSNPS
jgi:hypothetical protein